MMDDVSVINESEKKRLKSLKQKKKAFKLQKLIIQNSLQSIDVRSNKKIVFDDNFEILNSKESVEKSIKKKNILFDNDNEGEEQFEWNEEEFDAKNKLKQKLFKLKTNIGNDKRFTLDERFIDDDNEVKVKTQNDDDKTLDEKQWQLNILENVLGKPIKTINKNESVKKSNEMIRYDPTASNHKDYEITIENSKPDKSAKKKRKKKNIEIMEDTEVQKNTEVKTDTEIQNDISIPTSKDLFYDVSENLVKSLQETEQFSLLNTFGCKNINTDTNKNEPNNKPNNENEQNTSFSNNFNVKKFKYDSSDTEDEDKINNKNTVPLLETKESINYQKDDRLFFYNDTCFDEAINFFKNQSPLEEDVFKHKRRELKEIVRSKIRRNLKKSNPWNKKRIRKVKKQ